MGECIGVLREYWGYAAMLATLVLLIGGYGAIKLKDFLPVLKTLFSAMQEYPLGTWNCTWYCDPVPGEPVRPDITDVVTLDFAREEVVVGAGAGGVVKDGYKLVGRCTSSCLALTYKIADKDLPYVGAVVLRKLNEKRLEGHFAQYVIAADGSTAGLITGTTRWTKP